MTDGTDREWIADLVERSRSAETEAAYRSRVADQAAWLRERIEAGGFDSADFAVGLEMECYAVDPSAAAPRLARLPTGVFDTDATNKELGLHNLEVNTEPTVLDRTGLADQAAAIRDHTAAAREAVRQHDRELVLDGMFGIPPAEGTERYMSDATECNGVVFAENMRQDPRYVGIDNAALASADNGTIDLSVPGVDRAFPSILFESLTTSIQPHLQVPTADAFPDHYNVAIRTMGPVLALAANSPFLPADLYADVEDPAALVEATHHESRIPVFEQSVNTSPNPKVRVPRDIENVTAVLDRLLEDDLYAPFLWEWLDDETDRETLDDRIWELDYKRGTYWRWLRCVIGGDHVDADNDEYSLRIEYRPLPTQPTVTDVIGLQALTVGLIRGLVVADHPLTELPWAAAQASFYSAAAEGLDADLAWVTADGDRTSDPAVIFGEVFTYAHRGLDAAGVPAAEAQRYLEPIEARWAGRLTPSAWKKAHVRESLADGVAFDAAIVAMQHEYIDRSRATDSFAEWV